VKLSHRELQKLNYSFVNERHTPCRTNACCAKYRPSITPPAGLLSYAIAVIGIALLQWYPNFRMLAGLVAA
jgi:hypothetical protein